MHVASEESFKISVLLFFILYSKPYYMYNVHAFGVNLKGKLEDYMASIKPDGTNTLALIDAM